MNTTTQQNLTTTVLTVTQAAKYLGLAVSTLNKWRCHGGGPAFIKMGRAVRYKQADLEVYISKHKATSTSEYEEMK